jgi:hypothetical protein
MFKRLGVVAILLWVVCVSTFPVVAQGPIVPQHSDPTWQASYWNNMTLSGDPALQRAEANINHEWWSASPAAGIINADYFSARWTRYIDVTPGTYVFTVTSDDGMRLWVDGELILNEWREHPPQTFAVEKYLDAGHHLVQVEYFEKEGIATAIVQWNLKEQSSDPGAWHGEYFNNLTLGGTPVLTRNDAVIDFDWGIYSPAPGVVNADRFSVRWTRTLDLPAAMYTFLLTVDDGARLWVNGHLLVDAWIDQAPRTYSGQIYLTGGPVTIELQYYENMGGTVAKLVWFADGSSPTDPTPGTVIVDNQDTGFIKGGASSGWRSEAEGYSGQLFWTFNNRVINYNYNWARWFPDLQARRYEVFVYIPERFTTTAKARYWINHADDYTLKIVDQSTHGNSWVSLGTYRFRGTSDDYVSLADVTFEPYRTRLIAFDAVKWVPR